MSSLTGHSSPAFRSPLSPISLYLSKPLPTPLFVHQPAWLLPTTLMGSHAFGQLTTRLISCMGRFPPSSTNIMKRSPQIILPGPLTSKGVYTSPFFFCRFFIFFIHYIFHVLLIFFIFIEHFFLYILTFFCTRLTFSNHPYNFFSYYFSKIVVKHFCLYFKFLPIISIF